MCHPRCDDTRRPPCFQASEVSKLREAERRQIMDWVAEDVAGQVPVGFTIYGNSVAEQVAQVRHAEGVKADWVILQPPNVGTYAGFEYIRFFGRIADQTRLPVAIQNAPAYMGRGLTATEIRDLVTQHPNVRLLKGEGSVVDIRAVIEATEGRLPVLNGRGGLELTDNYRAGCIGMILAPDTIDKQVAIWRALKAGRDAEAEALYERALPSILFIMQSIETLICYGKRVFAARAGLTIHDRAPALRATEHGLRLVTEHATRLGAFPTTT
jgi:4-hydroxy-tetrahydrodipicolinate synthase